MPAKRLERDLGVSGGILAQIAKRQIDADWRLARWVQPGEVAFWRRSHSPASGASSHECQQKRSERVLASLVAFWRRSHSPASGASLASFARDAQNLFTIV
jgi:hypothetical protein